MDDLWTNWLFERFIICATNADVEEVNQILISQIESEPFVYRSADKVLNETEALKFPEEFLNRINVSGMPPHILELKKVFPFR